MRAKTLLLLAAINIVFVSPAQAQNATRRAKGSRSSAGSICLAPAKRPTAGEKSLSNPTGGNRISVYSVQVDNDPAVVVSNEKGILISRLNTGKKHSVKISGDGKQLESFSFTFSDYSSNKLCLWFNPLYETWSLWKTKNAGAKCRCQ
jgi:hypothetical protein